MEETRTARIVMMSKDLMKLYDVKGFSDGLEFQPITFLDPQECLEMLIETDGNEYIEDEIEMDSKADRIEKQWGELELLLSFFSDSFNWQ